MKKITLLILTLAFCSVGYSQSARKLRPGTKGAVAQRHGVIVNPVNPAATIFTDNMDGDNSLSGLALRGYTTYSRSIGAVDTTGLDLSPIWYQGDPSAFDAYNGPVDGYVASDYNSVGDSTGFIETLDNWLVLPLQAVAAGDSFSFWASAISGSTFADSIHVLYNPSGATLPEDANWVEWENFFVDPATGWARHAYAVPTASATGAFAIRYNVYDAGLGGNNSEYIGIDQIDIFDTTSVVIPTGSFDTCAFAIDISSIFGGAIGATSTMGPYDNTTATTNGDDPAAGPNSGWNCFGEPTGNASAPELNNTVWFTFTGDGNNYIITTNTSCAGVTNAIEDGDTQFALYTGTCGSLTPLRCNEDLGATGPPYPAGFSIGTQVGTVYHLMVDGFSFQGAVSAGEFCISVTRVASVACGDASVNAGIVGTNSNPICNNVPLTLTSTGAVPPTSGDYFGFSYVLSSADISNSTNPTGEASFLQAFNLTAAGSTLNLNITAAPAGIYYFTPVVFGNAVAAAGNPASLADLTLDPNCTFSGISVPVTILDSTDLACVSGVNENLPGKKVSMIAYPSPAQDVLHIDFTAAESQNGTIEITDYTGRVIFSQSQKINAGVNNVEMNVKSLSSGTYFVSLRGDAARNVKFIKQ